MTDKENSTSSIPIFTGQDKSKWRVFAARVLAYATEKGWDVALTSPDTTDKNTKAWSALLRLTDGQALNEVLKGSSSASAHDAWKKLTKKYKPKTTRQLLKLIGKRNACHL